MCDAVRLVPTISARWVTCLLLLLLLLPSLVSSEAAMGSKVIVQMNGAKTTLLDPSGAVQPKEFTFDYSYWSFDPAAPNFATNPKVYSDLGVSVLNNAWLGFNVCLFAYGQTGSGKSYSMVSAGGSTDRQMASFWAVFRLAASLWPGSAGFPTHSSRLVSVPCLPDRLDTERTK